MKKVAFITPESFLDVDIPIVKELNKHVELLWVVTYSMSPKENQHVFSHEQVLEYSRIYSIKYFSVLCSYRVRDPRRLMISFDILKKVKEFSPDVIYFNSFYDPYFALSSRLILGSQRTIIGLHDIELHPGSNSFFHRASNWVIMNFFHNYHVFSASQLDLFKVLHPDKRVFLIGLFLKDFGIPIRATLYKKSRKINFMFFGRDYPYKGLELIIKAVNILSEKSGNFKITIVGKCDNFDKYRNLILDQTLYDLHLRFINSEEIPEFFNTADFILLPYSQVTQCGPLLIAFNYNLPAIVSDLPYFKELIIDQETGILFHSGDYFQLAEIMYNLIEKPKIDILQIKNNLAAYVSENYKIDKFINKYLEMFLSI
jgi:glycosyltransferase involved in cell wall biosynthesis